jgi:hypothetical protein
MEGKSPLVQPSDGPAIEEHCNMSDPMAGIRRWLDAMSPEYRGKTKRRTQGYQKPPITSRERRLASLADAPVQLDQLGQATLKSELHSNETVLYLGYGSNMSAETFRGKRNIKPVSQVNAVIPQLSLTFDLPGVPYYEPCFGNVRYRHRTELDEKGAPRPPYHKDQWPKGLVGIVYEVTKADFVHIIATEGGGAAYQDVLVDCYALEEDPHEKVPMQPEGATFKAHTLFCPPNVLRPDPSYAQPSPRYLKLVTDGAEEHDLPYEYQEFLKSIGTYSPTTTKQRLGQFIFLAIWAPIFIFILGGAGMFLDKDGKYPKWYARFAMATFATCWGSYDAFFKTTFGDGERTIEEGDVEGSTMGEKEGLIRHHVRDYGVAGS